MNKKVVFTTLLVALTFVTNSQNWWGNKKIRGNGNVITETRTTSTYNALEVGGSFDVVLVKGDDGKITIKGEENIIPLIETEVSDNVLKIKYKKGINAYTSKKLLVTVSFRSLEKISLGGSGSISSAATIKNDYVKVSLAGSGNININIVTNKVKTAIAGSGTVKLQGNTNQLDSAITGSGDVKAYDLKTDELTVKITGSGSIKSYVASKINAKIVGSGSVYYKGNPSTIETKSVGSGEIVNRN